MSSKPHRVMLYLDLDPTDVCRTFIILDYRSRQRGPEACKDSQLHEWSKKAAEFLKS